MADRDVDLYDSRGSASGARSRRSAAGGANESVSRSARGRAGARARDCGAGCRRTHLRLRPPPLNPPAS